jgi:hypothetical protein
MTFSGSPSLAILARRQGAQAVRGEGTGHTPGLATGGTGVVKARLRLG